MQAWSSIVYSLIPNVRQLENNLAEFAQIIDADEVLLFERATFLVVSHAQRKTHRDPHRFEKVSNIVKQFKLSCRCEPTYCYFQHSNFNSFYNNNMIYMILLFKYCFELFCRSKLAAQFQSMEVRNSQFAAFIDVFTPNTYVMVIISDHSLRK